ncbi:hypothetical protein AAMO2058_001683300 [Amorphochlora amoebiformis]
MEEGWISYYRKLLSSLKSLSPDQDRNEDDYISILGILQACCDFSKPATIDEEKLLKSILSMDIKLTLSESETLEGLRKEFDQQKLLNGTFRRQTPANLESITEKMQAQERKIEAQARHVNVLMEQNRILLEAAKYHQQKATLVMAMHKNETADKSISSRFKANTSNSSTPSMAPAARTPSPGEFRQLSISTPPVTASTSTPTVRPCV